MNTRTEAFRQFRNGRAASNEAHQAATLIGQMAGTHANLALLLDALEDKISRQAWAAFSLALDHLQEATEALEDVYALSESDLDDAMIERMADDREAA